MINRLVGQMSRSAGGTLAARAPDQRTVTQILRVMGLADAAGFRRYHEVPSRACWDSRAVARRLLQSIIERLLPDGEVVMGIDDTIERRWGACIEARGINRHPVRSANGHFFKANGMRWLSLMVSQPIPSGLLATGACGGSEIERNPERQAPLFDQVDAAQCSYNTVRGVARTVRHRQQPTIVLAVPPLGPSEHKGLVQPKPSL
jgi:hypothetical protein